MPSAQVPIIRGDKASNQTDYLDKLPKNMIAVAKEIRGAAGYLISADGLVSYGTGAGLDRGGFYNDRQGILYRVSGNSLIKVSSNGTVTTIGSVAAGTDRASLSYSFNNQIITVGGNAYLSDGTTLTQITSAAIGNPIDNCWIDSYIFYTDGEFLYHSLINDESQVDPLQYATSEFSPDKTYGVLTTPDNLVMALNRYSIEYFQNAANPQFAFTRIPQKNIDGGICGTHCKVMIGSNVFILGGRRNESPAIHIVNAGSLAKLSTQTVDLILSKYTEEQLSTAVLEARTDERDVLLIVRLPNHTLVLNVGAMQAVGIQNAWTTFSYGIDGDKWLGANGVFDPRINKWTYGSAYGAELFQLDSITGAQNGQASEYEFSTPLVPLARVRVGTIELSTIPGFNLDTVRIFMAVSTNGVFEGMEYSEVYATPLGYDDDYMIRRSVGFIKREFSLHFRCVSKDKINVSNLVINYV